METRVIVVLVLLKSILSFVIVTRSYRWFSSDHVTAALYSDPSSLVVGNRPLKVAGLCPIVEVCCLEAEKEERRDHPVTSPIATDRPICPTVMHVYMLPSVRQTAHNPEDQRGIHLHHSKLLCQWSRPDGTVSSGKVRECDPHSACWLVQVSIHSI